MLPIIKVALNDLDGFRIPTRKHPDDAGMDLYASINQEVGCLCATVIPTGVHVNIPKGYVGLVWPKSRHDFLIGGGVIDTGYEGEILVKIINIGQRFMVHKDEPIAQLLIMPVATPEIVQVPRNELYDEPSERGATGGIVSQVEEK